MSDQWPPPPDWYYRAPLSDVRKIATVVPMSAAQLLAWGAITEEEALEMGWTPPPPMSRLTRLRWAWADWRHNHRPHLHLGPCDPEERL